jgi:hypothetical protein
MTEIGNLDIIFGKLNSNVCGGVLMKRLRESCVTNNTFSEELTLVAKTFREFFSD